MSSLFQNLPQTPAMIAAVRDLCDERGLPARCRRPACQRAGRCRGLWVEDQHVERLRLPPCLMAALEDLHMTLREARNELLDLETAVAVIRKLPDPDEAAERGVYPVGAAWEDDPFELEDWA